ncbi:hypothetical protein SNK04_007308 [Fusarium graminearum]
MDTEAVELGKDFQHHRIAPDTQDMIDFNAFEFLLRLHPSADILYVHRPNSCNPNYDHCKTNGELSNISPITTSLSRHNKTRLSKSKDNIPSIRDREARI